MKRGGWYGHSQQHSLARRGVRTAVRRPSVLKSKLSDPIFLAKRRESALPFPELMQMVASGLTLQQMRERHPEVDADDVRRRGIRAIEAREGDNVLSKLDEQGVDDSVRMAKVSPTFRERAREVLDDSQKVSFIHPEKAMLLRKRLDEC